MHKVHYHLNEAQREFIRKWIADNPTRPKFGAYDKSSRAIAKIPVAGKKPTAKSVPGTAQGYHSNQLVPGPTFNALKQLPPGWAIESDFDSGGNHRIHNAGEAMLRALWNCWSSHSKGPISALSVTGSHLQRQLLANNIDLPT